MITEERWLEKSFHQQLFKEKAGKSKSQFRRVWRISSFCKTVDLLFNPESLLYYHLMELFKLY
jgi:hypothetical protein